MKRPVGELLLEELGRELNETRFAVSIIDGITRPAYDPLRDRLAELEQEMARRLGEPEQTRDPESGVILIAVLLIIAIAGLLYVGGWAVQTNRSWGYGPLILALLLLGSWIAWEVRKSKPPTLRSLPPVEEPAVSAEAEKTLCSAATPVEVRRLNESLPPRKRAYGSGPHAWPVPSRRERGIAAADILGPIACGVIVGILCALALSGCSARIRASSEPAQESAQRGTCKEEALRRIAEDLSFAVSSGATARARLATRPAGMDGADETGLRQWLAYYESRATAMRAEYRRIEKEGCGL